jgi:hypothetical protein
VSEPKRVKDYASMTQAELAADDAETEAEFQKVVAATKRPKLRKRARQHIGCPWEFFVYVRQHTRGGAALLVALCVYRQTIRTRRCQAVTLPGPDLIELGISRSLKRKALCELEAAGIVRLTRMGPGQKTEVALLWRPTTSAP